MVEHFSGCQIQYCSLVAAHCGIIQLAAPPPGMYCVSADGARWILFREGSSGRGGRETVASGGAVATGESEVWLTHPQCRGRKVESPAARTGTTHDTHCTE